MLTTEHLEELKHYIHLVEIIKSKPEEFEQLVKLFHDCFQRSLQITGANNGDPPTIYEEVPEDELRVMRVTIKEFLDLLFMGRWALP